MGQLIKAQKDTVGLAPAGRPSTKIGFSKNPISRPPSLKESGIDKNLADRARKIAAVPESQFEGMVADWRERVEQENEGVTALV